jgi:hypothetical protein
MKIRKIRSKKLSNNSLISAGIWLSLNYPKEFQFNEVTSELSTLDTSAMIRKIADDEFRMGSVICMDIYAIAFEFRR